jgi:ribulose-phosphate 3-epimerase
MARVTPVINCQHGDKACVTAKLDALRSFTDRVHLDIADARFTLHASWAEPEEWKKIGAGIHLEAHLMAEEPAMLLSGWLDAGAERIIIHLEALQPPPYHVGNMTTQELIQQVKGMCEARGATFVLALNPETPFEALLPYATLVKDFCLLAVHAGPAGQPFLPLTLQKIRALRAAVPDAKIEVDGGVTPETARQAFEAGATSVCAGTYVFENAAPAEAFAALENALQ